MNFHKKIGFLAALLLMIGLGAPDSFAQNTISVTLVRNIPHGWCSRGGKNGRGCNGDVISYSLMMVQL